MRKFIYLDTNTLNSYVSQIDNGLITEITEELENSNQTTKTNSQALSTTGNVDLTILKKGINSSGGIELAHEKEKQESASSKNILSKQSYDEIFDKFLKNIQEDELLKEKDKIEKMGDFIKINSNISIVDLQYYLDLFGDDGFINFFSKQEVENQTKLLDEQFQELSKTGRNTAKLKYQAEKMKKDLQKETEKSYKNTADIIKAIMTVIPYNKMIFTEDCIITIDDNYLRDNSKIVAHKYGGDLEIIGYVTNEIKRQPAKTREEEEKENIFETFPGIVNTILLDMFKKNTLLVIHPIAIYYK